MKFEARLGWETVGGRVQDTRLVEDRKRVNCGDEGCAIDLRRARA